MVATRSWGKVVGEAKRRRKTCGVEPHAEMGIDDGGGDGRERFYEAGRGGWSRNREEESESHARGEQGCEGAHTYAEFGPKGVG